MLRRTFLLCAATTLPLAFQHSAQAQNDWPVFGHDPGANRYSTITQINAGNVSKLVQAWTYNSKPTPDAKTTWASKTTPMNRRPGKLLWETKLPANGYANPITYLGKNGKQYVVIDANESVVAFSLP